MKKHYKNFLMAPVLAMMIAPSVYADVKISDDLKTGNNLAKYSNSRSRELFRVDIPDVDNETLTETNMVFKSYYLDDARSREELQTVIDIYLKNIKNQDKPDAAVTVKKVKLGKDVRKALKYLGDVTSELSKSYDKNEVNFELMEKAFEIADSINMNYKNIILPRIRIGRNLINILQGELNSRAGEHPLSLSQDRMPVEEDPQNSTFWQKPQKLADRDVVVSFGRKSIPEYAKQVFEYDQPKTGHGMHPGFRVKFDGTQYKIRLGKNGYASKKNNSEYRVGPFSARILYAFGYNSLPIDALPLLRVKYDRRLFSEYNSRAGIPLEVGFGKNKGFDVYDGTFNPYLDPFANVLEVILKDGTRVNRDEFKELLIDSNRKKAARDADEYNTEFEKTISEVHYKNVSIEKMDEDYMSIGPWDWNSQRHIEHKELRGYALLAVWLGQYDARVDNTRLILVKDKTNDMLVMRHYISDVGSGLGAANPFLHSSTDKIEKFSEEVIRINPKNDQEVISKGYQTFTTNKTFEAMNVKDAKWMLGYIDQLTEKQIRSALKVSNFSKEEENEVYRKLMLRKQNIKDVLGQIKIKSESLEKN